jgi:hypothetical protein
MELIEQIENINGKPLEEEDKAEIDLWQKGRDLAHLVNTPGWSVVIEMLQSYVTQNVNSLMNIDPGKKDEVLATHAIMFAAGRIFRLFQEDVTNAITASRKTPEVVKQGIRRSSPIPPESL